jgi:peptidoglycan/xylan/chitin deacetylase (PgdA/CDA1 family)
MLQNKTSVLVILFCLVVIIIAVVLINSSKDSCNSHYLTFSFDDGYSKIYTDVFPLFQDSGIKATVYVPVNFVGKSFENRSIMNFDELRQLEARGWEIGSHSLNHTFLTQLSYDEIDKDLNYSKEILVKNGINARTLSIPYGKYNETIEEIAKKYYNAARPSELGYNSLEGFDEYRLRSLWILNSTSFEEMKGWIDETAKNNYWTILMIHYVDNDKKQEYDMLFDDLKNLVAYAKSKDIKIRTVSEVIESCRK